MATVINFFMFIYEPRS